MSHRPAQALIAEARREAEKLAAGPFTPVVFERYEFIGGERGVRLGYATETEDGQACVRWDHRCANRAAA